MTSSVPIRDSVGAAFAFVRENLRFIAIVAAAGAAATTLIGAITLGAPALSLVTAIFSTFVQAFAYAALVGAALFGGGAARMRWTNDGGRVWAAMAIIGLFLFIVMFVASIIASIVLFAGPLASYVPELERAGGDQAVAFGVLMRFIEQNPIPVLLVTLFFGAIWMLLTSRLYAAAPATVDRQRIVTFETWSWTKGAMLRITGARIMLLFPANLFVGAIGHLIGRLFGINTLDPATTPGVAASNPAGYLLFVFIASFLTLCLYSSLEAGLSSAIYRGLKPEAPQTPPA